MTTVSEPLPAHSEPARPRAAPLLRHFVPVAAAFALGAGLESVRRGLTTPSLIDDWFGIAYGRRAFEAVSHLSYGAHTVDFAGRYRPAYTGLWNYLQWHAFGSPSVHTAAAWGIVRIAMFVLAVWLLAAWTNRQWGALVAWLAPLAVCLTPGFAVDLVRHGPADPLMLAGLILGLAAIGTGVRNLLFSDAGAHWAIPLIGVGYGVYLFGVYSKEASIAALAFAPFFWKWAWPSARGRVRGSRRRVFLLGLVAALVVAPLVHIAAHVALATANDQNPYPLAHFSLATRALAAGVWPLIGAPGPLGTVLWLVVTPVAVASVFRAVLRRERDAWLLAGLLTTGYLMSAFSLQRGDTPSRYYLPWIVAISAIALRAVTLRNRRLVAAGAVLVVGLTTVTSTRAALATWTTDERSGSVALDLAKRVVTGDCPLYLVNFDVERRFAIPRLLPLVQGRPLEACKGSERDAYALTWQTTSLPTGFGHRCRAHWAKLDEQQDVSLYRCTSFSAGPFLDQDAASSAPRIQIVRLRTPTVDDPRAFTPPVERR